MGGEVMMFARDWQKVLVREKNKYYNDNGDSR